MTQHATAWDKDRSADLLAKTPSEISGFRRSWNGNPNSLGLRDLVRWRTATARFRGLIRPVLVGLCIAPVAAVQADEARPWAESAIKAHVDRSDFLGALDRENLDRLTEAGESLFTARFAVNDGAGRPMATQAIIPTKRKRAAKDIFARTAGSDANACTSCHNEPRAGGAGSFVANVFVSEGFTNADFDTTDPQFSNERNTNHLFGAGLVELLAREMTADLHRQRADTLAGARGSGTSLSTELVTKGVSFGSITAHPDGMMDLDGIEGVDSDLVIRPFSQKGVFPSLRQFTVNALNHHHGMQPTERFGARWTGEADFDEDGKADEITDGDVTALVAWQATLPPPVTIVPMQEEWQAAAAAGSAQFDAFECSSCHIPTLPLDSLAFADPGPLDMAGTLREGEADPTIIDLQLLKWAADLPRNPAGQVMVPLFGDLKRHKMTDQQIAGLGNELLSQRFVERDVFQTSELWGIASTAPYGHRGDFTTLDEIIRAHGGDARSARDAYLDASDDERDALIAFLKTLGIAP